MKNECLKPTSSLIEESRLEREYPCPGLLKHYEYNKYVQKYTFVSTICLFRISENRAASEKVENQA